MRFTSQLTRTRERPSVLVLSVVTHASSAIAKSSGRTHRQQNGSAPVDASPRPQMYALVLRFVKTALMSGGSTLVHVALSAEYSVAMEIGKSTIARHCIYWSQCRNCPPCPNLRPWYC